MVLDEIRYPFDAVPSSGLRPKSPKPTNILYWPSTLAQVLDPPSTMDSFPEKSAFTRVAMFSRKSALLVQVRAPSAVCRCYRMNRIIKYVSPPSGTTATTLDYGDIFWGARYLSATISLASFCSDVCVRTCVARRVLVDRPDVWDVSIVFAGSLTRLGSSSHLLSLPSCSVRQSYVGIKPRLAGLVCVQFTQYASSPGCNLPRSM